MADWLVLENWKGRIGQQDIRILAGTVIDDTQEPVATMLANGAALVPDDTAYDTARARWNEAYDPTDPADAGETMMAVLMANGVAPGGGITPRGGELFVDGSFTGTSTGSRDNPAKTYAAAAALASAGDVIKIFPGTYAEDLATVADVDVWGLCPPKSGRVLFTGQLTAAHNGNCNLVNLAFTEAGAGASACEITGAVATVLNLSGCLFTAGALADYAFLLNAAASVVRIDECVFTTITGNANETFQLIAGTLHVESAYVTHADGITGPTSAVVETGAGVLSVTWNNVRIQGNVVPTGAAQNPTNTFTNCRIATGANSAIQTTSTNLCVVYHSELVSADAGGLAVDGAGIFHHSGLSLTGTARDLSGALNAGAGPDSEIAWERPLTNALFVDPAYGVGSSNGSARHPFTAIGDALAIAPANCTVFAAYAVYTEDLGLVDNVRVVGLSGPRGEAPLVIGTATADGIGCTIEDMSFTDDGAGNAVYFTGAAPATLTLIRCLLTGTATGGSPLEMDNTDAAAAVVLNDTQIVMTTGNAAEVVRVEMGTLNGYDCIINHEDNVSESLVAEGDAATTINLFRCTFQGQIGSEAAVANPAIILRDCEIVVGAVSGILIAAGNEVELRGRTVIDSTEAANHAIGGTGDLMVAGDIDFTNTADEIDAGLNDVQFRVSLREQSGTYNEAVGAGARVITLNPEMPHANYAVTCSAKGALNTVFASGYLQNQFTLNTGGIGDFDWHLRLLDT